MRIQEAAYKILEEFGRPLSPEEITKISLDRGWVSSKSKDPVFSLKTTIMKNIRDGVYNTPKLIFLKSPQGRLIGLPHWEGKSAPQPQGSMNTIKYIEMKARIPVELFEKIQLAGQAKIAENSDEVVIKLLTEGLSVLTPEIKEKAPRTTQPIGHLNKITCQRKKPFKNYRSYFKHFLFYPSVRCAMIGNKDQPILIKFTPKYTKIESGYLGQLLEWPEMVTEGQDLEDCRTMLQDALQKMILAYREQGKEIPRWTDEHN